MFKARQFKLKASEIVQLLAKNLGAGLASDRITVCGELVNYMYREEPENEVDSGWRFLSGTESQEFAENPDNWAYYDLNTIANYDPAIIPYLTHSIGAELERVEGQAAFRLTEE